MFMEELWIIPTATNMNKHHLENAGSLQKSIADSATSLKSFLESFYFRSENQGDGSDSFQEWK